jgi:hypothetical protein
MFAAARQRIRKKPAIRKNMARRRRRVRVQSAKHAAELHEELVSHLTDAQLARLKAEFTKLDTESYGFLLPKDLLPVGTALPPFLCSPKRLRRSQRAMVSFITVRCVSCAAAGPHKTARRSAIPF